MTTPNQGFTESTVEDAALQWFGELRFTSKHGPRIAPGELAAERTGFRLRPTSAFVRLLRDTSARHVGETVLAKQLRQVLPAAGGASADSCRRRGDQRRDIIVLEN